MTDTALLSAYVIASNGQAKALQAQQLAQPCQPDEYIWIHLQSDATDTETLLSQLPLQN